MKKLAVWVLVLGLLLSCTLAQAEMIFDGKVTNGETVFLLAPFGGTVESAFKQAGDRVEKGETAARIATTSVYAPVEGVITGVFGLPGDATESVSERYGAVMYVEPTNKYVISASTEKAYNVSENKFIHVGEEVYMRCTADATHLGTGRVISVSEDGTYKIEATGGEFCIAETVGVYRNSKHTAASRIGMGTVKAASPVPVKGSGSIISLHVKNGDFVERGELLFETAEGALSGLFAPGAEVVSGVSGIVLSVDAPKGTAVSGGAKVMTIAPDDAMYVEIQVLESDLIGISEGMNVEIDLMWNSDAGERIKGQVARISHVNSAETGEATYQAYVHFQGDDTIRLGMTALVYVSGEEDTNADDGIAFPDEKTDEAVQ